MLAVFGQGRDSRAAEAPPPAKRAKRESDDEEEEDPVCALLAPLQNSVPLRRRALIQEVFFGGMNGLSYVEGSMDSSMGAEDGVTCFMLGSLEDAEHSDESDAEHLISLYRKIEWDPDVYGEEATAMRLINELEGDFSFVLFDENSGRVVAARDVQGQHPLFWGTSMLGGHLMFGTDRTMVEQQCADADEFPSGAVFYRVPEEETGTLVNIAPVGAAGQGDKGMNGQGGSTADLCRVASGADLTRVASQDHIFF